MRNPDYQSNWSTLITIAILLAIFITLFFGAADEQAIRETELDKRLINSRIVFVFTPFQRYPGVGSGNPAPKP